MSKLLEVVGAKVYKELVEYKDKNTGDLKSFYVWHFGYQKGDKKISVKFVPNRENLKYVEEYVGYETKEVESE